jgi:hypothetical protein
MEILAILLVIEETLLTQNFWSKWVLFVHHFGLAEHRPSDVGSE